MTDLLQLLTPGILVLVAWSGFASFVFIKSPTPYLMRWTLIPASLVAAALFGLLMFVSYGYAAPVPLPDTFEFLGYNVVIKGNKKVAIEVWVAGSRSRLHAIPYSADAEAKLKVAAAQRKAGGIVRMTRGPKNDKGQGDKTGRDDYPYESNVLMPPDINPKTTP